MGREQERIRRKLENNPVLECNKVRRRHCPNLFHDFADTKDPRNLSYTGHSNDELLGAMFYKGIAGIQSMQSMTYEFNRENTIKNLYRFMGRKEKEYLPHAVTVNEYLERLDPDELQKVQQKQVYGLIRSKTFYGARFQKKWLVIVDGTQLYYGSRRLNERCLERHYNKGTQEETVNYHCDVLEAKIVLGDSLVILLADSLYASEPVMATCRENDWEFLIRYKTGSIPCITEEYEAILEKDTSGHAEFVNGINYNGKTVNMLRFWEEKRVKGETVRTDFRWLTSLQISKKDARKLAGAVRKRWKIENEGFNRQKNWQGDITHACSHNAAAMKNHHLMPQISDMIKQLYEWFCLKARGIKKKQKIYLPNC